MKNGETLYGIAEQVALEAKRAADIYEPMNGPHEAYAIIKEEFEEFWEEVKAYSIPKGRDTRANMRLELIQTAAMCIRTIKDLGL
jgi:hypothetical protein